ncbi:hypothetical protein HDK90DRAFT_90278 [Phyllosticta capitalensis]|uniref:Uncharacterized protein n=1 Tax=Phyllosticta capitalensis TaxID=121624 RepID=A0ABR1YBC4_9PEZI
MEPDEQARHRPRSRSAPGWKRLGVGESVGQRMTYMHTVGLSLLPCLRICKTWMVEQIRTPTRRCAGCGHHQLGWLRVTGQVPSAGYGILFVVLHGLQGNIESLQCFLSRGSQSVLGVTGCRQWFDVDTDVVACALMPGLRSGSPPPGEERSGLSPVGWRWLETRAARQRRGQCVCELTVRSKKALIGSQRGWGVRIPAGFFFFPSTSAGPSGVTR